MQHLNFKKSLGIFLPMLAIALSLLPLVSCKQNEQQQENLVMYCRQLNKTDVQTSWASKGWTKAGDPNFITQLWFNVNKIKTSIQIDVNPMKSYDQPILNGKIALIKETDCEQSLPTTAEYMDNWISFDSLHIIADPATGSLIDFDFIRLTPVQGYPPYVNYKVDVIKNNGGEKILFSATSYPCPPHCPKPPTVADENQKNE